VALKSIDTAVPPVRAALSDEQERALLARIAEHREQAAFRQLYSIYYQRLTRLLGRMSLRREDVEEIINDTFWVVWTKAADFRGASQLSTSLGSSVLPIAVRSIHCAAIAFARSAANQSSKT
jgi:hypothetical protein